MKRLLILALAAWLAGTGHAEEAKQAALDLEKYSAGGLPADVVVVDGDIAIGTHEGKKVLEISAAKPEVDAGAVVGISANGTAMIEAHALATKAGRSFPRFGIGLHGQTGCRLMIVPARKELQLLKNDEVVKAVPFDWKSGAWIALKLEAKKIDGNSWRVSAKAWPADAAEPAEAQIVHDDATLRTHGQCSIWGTPYSGTPIYFSHLKVTTGG